MLPKYIYRKDDGFRFTLQSNGKYTMDKCGMKPKYQYHYSALSGLDFVLDKKDIRIKYYMSKNDGHGNGDLDE